MLYLFKRAYRRIKRFIAWFPIIWDDEDWDYAYLYEIMRFKISRMRKEIDSNKRHIGYEKNVRYMKIAEELLHRMSFSDFYFDLEQKLEQQEKKDRCSCPEPDFKVVDIGNNMLQRISLTCDFCNHNFKRWLDRDRKKQKEDRKYLFELLDKRSNKWWD